MTQQVVKTELDEAVKQSPRKWVYLFSEGNATMRELLGGKGAGVAEMTNAGLPVPPGFTITTEACNTYYEAGKQFPEGVWEQVLAAVKVLERQTGKGFGQKENPLLVSVRSGAKFSMPGMMDTVLNLGINDETVQGLIELTGDERFAYDAYRRFIQMFSKIVLNANPQDFEQVLDEYKEKAGVKTDAEIPADALKQLVVEFKQIAEQSSGQPFPTDVYEQLHKAIEAVFSSWNNKRAIDYRNFNKIPHTLGTAVNVQTMVFGNMGNDSGTGVAFTRNPATGEKEIYGEYLLNAQGEDVVAGIRTPSKISKLQEELPEVYKQFLEIAQRLEQHYRDMQDLEFTVEKGRLYMLQTRSAKRTAAAAVRVAVDMVKEGLISEEEAVKRVEPAQVYQLLLPRFDEEEKATATLNGRLLARGLNASPGAACGQAVFDADRAEELGKAGVPVVLVRPETSPDDVHGMLVAKGILTARGGATSHAAVVARGLGLPCVAGCEAIRVSENEKVFRVEGSDVVIKEGDPISIDGATGEVFQGSIRTVDPDFEKEENLRTLLAWADKFRKLGIWANADYPRDAGRAVVFGAEGIGLCRTEHMFMEQERLPIVQRMILAKTREERQAALDRLLPFQRADFQGIFEAMVNPETGEGYPVVIRLIDPPLHEFLPSYEELLVDVTRLETQGGHEEELEQKRQLLEEVAAMREMNPMLGLRGCRLGLLFPEINVMQTRAILEAAAAVAKKGIKVHPKIMIPLVGHVNELREVRRQLETVAKEIAQETGEAVDYKFGTMIEVPRAALTADQIATVADFFSFGTNDLTQTTFGYSRDDAEGKFLLKYVDGLEVPGTHEKVKILPVNPFQSLDRDGVGQLVAMAVEKGRKTKPEIELGICGEHGGDPDSIAFCHEVGLAYVSCSPFRVPVARLAAAQAALSKVEKDK
ncbi:pyruvate phosphate dikinase [Thermosporothrix hazakensis]|uniref:Pyruvate, phosphate dikinase n=2 Tax=Thermosporothrix TaxID=768650 RepID=A0A326TUP9_THEHA|nr:pyruvate, phosphate dikinase [Thermosporothrix hazakensis]PZW19739.1 pyruvate phosphate dikinase [Thermosporothrix hazakensis]BBH90554.1 pyruvate, phosphate dikinase [Thermosporothrix sp. COM3]GCE48607.1 pyruvate, phosphate dikinase [Thermosporothrix hazakensis]